MKGKREEKTIMRIVNLENENRKFIKTVDNFHVLEYVQDASVSPRNAIDEYFMSKMNVRRRQVVIDISKDHSAVIQAGAMQWMGGNVHATSGVKGIGDLFGKALKGAVTKESAVKPEYVGEGLVNVYRGTGRVLMSPVAPTSSLLESTNTINAKAAARNSNTLGK